MAEKKREIFLDKLRVAATCAVVLLHTVTGIMDATDMRAFPLEKRVFLVTLDLVCWCVPVFLLISGYLFLNPDREISFRQMLTKYCRRILFALFLFGVPFAWMELAANEKSFHPAMLWQGVGMVLQGKSWSHLWYLYLVLLLYLLTPAIRWILRRIPLGAVYAILFVLLMGSSILPFLKKLLNLEWMWVMPDGGIYFFYYICGYRFATCGKRVLRPWLPAVCAAVLAVGMLLSRISGNYTVQMAYNYPFTVLLALLLFTFGFGRQKCRSTEKRNTGFWERAGALCFAVYLIHPVFLNIYYKFLHISPLDFNIWISLPAFFLAALLPAILAAWILRKISILKKYVL